VAALHSLGQGKHVNTILILDDEAPIRTLLRVTLCPLGYTLVEAATANEAVRCLEYADAGLDLLIADVYLTGDPSGVRVALELRSKLPFLRIILMSGVPLTFWDDRSKGKPAQGFLDPEDKRLPEIFFRGRKARSLWQHQKGHVSSKSTDGCHHLDWSGARAGGHGGGD
jgi:hypothetical protein